MGAAIFAFTISRRAPSLASTVGGEERLLDDHYLLNAIFEGTANIVFVLDKNLRHVMINSSGAEFFGLDAGDIVGKSITDLFPEATAADLIKRNRYVLETGESVTLEHGMDGEDGRKRYWMTTRLPWLDPDGNIVGVIGVARDITDAKQSEQRMRASLIEKEALLKEIHHRVKNNLQVISGLLFLQSEDVNDPQLRRALSDTQSRVQSIALIHERLYKAEDLAHVDFAEYFQPWKNYVLDCFAVDTSRIRLKSDIQPVELSIDQAVPCALIINELVTNALKHAFPNGRAGSITVSLKVAGDDCLLCVSDDGIGIAQPSLGQTTSLGLRLVDILTRQLKGNVRVDGASGARFEIAFHRFPQKEGKRAA